MKSLLDIAVFTQVIDKGSFTAAATSLNMSRPVVSRQVQRLEDYLGVRLINRTTRRLHLTEAGERFYQRCQRIMEEISDAEHDAGEQQSMPRGTLHLNVSYSYGYAEIMPRLAGFQKRYPEINIDISFDNREIDMVEEGVDLVIRITRETDIKFAGRLLSSCRIPLVASPDYWKRHGKPEHPGELTDHNCLHYTPIGNNQWVFDDPDGQQIVVAISGNLKSTDDRVLVEAAASGQGICFAPEFMTRELRANGQLETALDDYTQQAFNIYALYPHRKFVSAKVRCFIDYLVDPSSQTPGIIS